MRAKAAARELPVIVYTGKDLTPEDDEALKKYAQSVILKSAVHSPERLLSETALFLHRVESQLPERSKAVLEASRHSDASVAGRKVLVVDDDVRNIFAMTSVLEASGLEVIYAENGQAGIEALTKDPGIDLVLMDVMMPGMDGYETMRAIRANPIFRGIPIVAITAKALKDDRNKCLEAGASDYLPKPVDTEKLLDLIRLWTGNGEGVAAAVAEDGSEIRRGPSARGSGRRPANGRAARQHPDRRRSPGEPGGAGGDPGAARPRAGDGAIGRRGAARRSCSATSRSSCWTCRWRT